MNLIKRFLKKIITSLRLNKLLFLTLRLTSRQKTEMDSKIATDILQKTSPRPNGKCMIKNTVASDPSVDLQIIIPAYNVEKYLSQCLDSVFSQVTKYSYCVVLIDDGSTDSTGKIADSYADRENIKIIHQNNKGFSGARNAGLHDIFGKYITFVDSDDVIAPGAIDTWLDTAFSEDADIVECGFYRFSDTEKYIAYKHKEKKQVTALGGLKGFTCGKVYKSDIFSCVSFPDGYWFEDSINSLIIYPKVKKAFVIPEVLYGYRLNPKSISNTASDNPKCIDSYYVFEQLLKEYKESGNEFDDRYRTKFFYQMLTNYQRTRNMPSDVKKAIFTLTCDLYKKYFSTHYNKRGNVYWHKALIQKDFGTYCLLCNLKVLDKF